MSKGMKIALAVVTGLGGIGFLLVGIASREASPRGTWAFYGLAGVCGAATAFCLFPLNQGQERKAPLRTDSIGRDLDLSRLTLAGWLLAASAAAIFLGVGILAAHESPQVFGYPRLRRGLAFLGIGVAIAFFYAGKYLLNKLGFPVLRPPRTSPDRNPE
jgi:hypothetical protein